MDPVHEMRTPSSQDHGAYQQNSIVRPPHTECSPYRNRRPLSGFCYTSGLDIDHLVNMPLSAIRAGLESAPWRPVGRDLYRIASHNCPALLQLLLDYDTNPDEGSYTDGPALYAAAKRGHIENVRVLLAGGANPNLTRARHIEGYDAWGGRGDLSYTSHTTPLYKAVEGQHTEVALALLQGHADPNLMQESNLFYLAARDNADPNMVRILLAHGTRPPTDPSFYCNLTAQLGSHHPIVVMMEKARNRPERTKMKAAHTEMEAAHTDGRSLRSRLSRILLCAR